MRPDILTPLFRSVTGLPGVGPRIGKLLERLAGPKVVDLLWHLPREVVDRRYSPTIDSAEEARIATITVTVGRHEPSRVKRQQYIFRCQIVF